MRCFVENINTAQGCILLLVLREHLKDFYGLNEAKIEAYSPSESQKIYEKSVTRKGNAKSNPTATVEILKLGDIDPSHMNEDAKKHPQTQSYLTLCLMIRL
jgi:cohesin loading factor subunit SCC2